MSKEEKGKIMEIETRAQASNGLEFRILPTEVRSEATEGEESRRVVGLGVVYEQEVEIWPGYREKILKNAFKESVEKKRDRPIKSFFNHNPNFVLSTQKSDPPLLLKNTKDGVEYDSPIPDTSYGRDLVVNLDRKNVEGSSFAFMITEDKCWEENDIYYRHIKKGEMFETGPVTDPAFLQTPTSLRSAKDAFEDARQRIQEQRDAKQAEEQRKKEQEAEEAARQQKEKEKQEDLKRRKAFFALAERDLELLELELTTNIGE